MMAHTKILQNILRAFIFSTTILLCANAAIASPDFDSGMQLIQDKEYNKALACFDRCVDSDPTNANFHYWRGKVLAVTDKIKEACAEYKLAAMLATDPQVKDDCGREL